jgi:hypothetical protein
MRDQTRHRLVAAALLSGGAVMSKSASASADQQEVLENVWPSADEGISKKATLARIIAAGAIVEEAAMSEAHGDG